MATGDVIRTVITGVAAGVPIVNTFHYTMGTGSPAPDLMTMAASFVSMVYSSYHTMLTTDYYNDTIVHTVISGPNTGMQYIDTSVAGTRGTLAPPSANLTINWVMQRRSGLANRSGRGRVFLAPIQASVFSDIGTILATPAGNNAFAAACLATLVDGFGNPYLSCLFKVAGSVVTLLNVAFNSERAGAMRRRRLPIP